MSRIEYVLREIQQLIDFYDKIKAKKKAIFEVSSEILFLTAKHAKVFL